MIKVIISFAIGALYIINNYYNYNDNGNNVYNIYPQNDKTAIFTAYTLSKEETDDNPCIAAGNINLCKITKQSPKKCIVATRLYPLYTYIYVKNIGTCQVLDRISLKYKDRIDILFANRSDALKFGKKELKYRVINNLN